MPRSAPQVLVPVRKQHEIARNELGLQAAHMSQPWLCWIGITALGIVLRAGFPSLHLLSAILVLVLGAVILALDLHLRRHHDTTPGKLIGPATITLAAGSLAVFILAGLSTALSLIYFTGGIALCACWDYWLRSAEHRDLTKAFIAAAEKSGVGGTRMLHLHRGARKATARLKHDPGLVTTADVTGNVERIESSLGHPPGSWTVTPDPLNAGYSRVSISDPMILDAAPLPWPGPSKPGASIAEPVRCGLWQDAEEMWYCLLDHHLLGMGATNSGKTISWAWGQIAEAITRRDYACFAADITKGEQFLGPLRPALHALETGPDGVLGLLAGITRIGDARAAYMAKNHLTQWTPDCGLTFCDFWLEECADIVALLGDKERGGGPAKVRQWKSEVRRMRSFGGRWNLSTQRADFAEVPTLVRGQMGKMCFGIMDPQDAEFGLTAEQRERGCRPQLWGTRVPGKCYIDALSIPDDRRAMPMRWWYWGPDSTAIAEYAALPEHAASRRPLDDVTGEALEAVPPSLASLTFPVPVRPAPLPLPALSSSLPADDDEDEDEHEDGADESWRETGGKMTNGGTTLALVRPLHMNPKPAAIVPDDLPPRPSQIEAEQYIRAQIALWASEGVRDFIKRDWDPVLGVVQRKSSWLYNTVFPNLVSDGVLRRHADGRLTRWEILEAKTEDTE